MNPGPDHEAVQEMLAAAALGTLDDVELRRVVTHARACPECARALEGYREAAASLAFLLPTERLDPARSDRIKARLLARVRAGKAGGAISSWRADRWIGLAVAAGLAGILLVHHSVHRPLDYGWLAAGILALVLVVVGVYARAQRRRVAALQAGRDQEVEVEKPRV